jgi:hypothetical protein
MEKCRQFTYTSILSQVSLANVEYEQVYNSNTILNYCAHTSFTQKLNLIEKGEQYILQHVLHVSTHSSISHSTQI